MTYYKLMNNNMVMDLLQGEVHYVRYLPNSKKTVTVQKGAANGVLGSDNETIYHLAGTNNVFPTEKTSVIVCEIGAGEYSSLATQFAIQRQENDNLKERITNLEGLVNQQTSLLQEQNSMLAALLSKLG